MKYQICFEEEGALFVKCELPGNLNNDKILEMIKIYLFNKEYEWTRLTVKKVE